MIRLFKEITIVVVASILFLLLMIYWIIEDIWETVLTWLGWYDFISKRPMLNFVLSTKWNLKIIERWQQEKDDWIDFANFRKGK